jgi:hypothetical protein
MASTPAFSSNPFSSFDPSQWSNPYSPFPSQAIPWPSSYVGTPTDSLGNPIQSYQAQQPQPAPTAPGLTLNSTPDWSNLSPQMRIDARNNPNAMTAASQQADPNDRALVAAWLGPTEQAKADMGIASTIGQQQQPQAAPPAAPSGLNNSAAYLSALAHPNRVVTPGATVPQSPNSYQPGSGALQQFLSQWRPAASGPGSGFQQGFYNTLKGR